MKVKDLIERYGPVVSAVLANVPEAFVGNGNVWFVDSGNANATDANDGIHGHTPDLPLATIHYANQLCTASQGDTILVAAGHTEAVADSDELELDVAGVTVQGYGSGSLIPTVTLGTATDAAIAVSAPNVTIRGIKVISDLENMAAGITLSALADGAVIENCIISDGAADKELIIGISVTAACNNVTIRNNRFLTTDGGGCASAVKFVGASNDSVIEDNVIYGDYSAAALDLATAASTRIVVRRNLIRNADTTASFAVDCHANTTGWLADNYCATEGGAHGDAIATADMACAGNLASGADGAQGIAEPGVDT